METYIAIDLETTGLSPKLDRIVEIGAVRVEDGQITDELKLFVDPGRELPARITELTGITQDMLKDAVSQETAIRQVTDFCEDLVLLGHNILFDYSFLKRSAVNHGLPFVHQGIDTLKLARNFLPDAESRRLEDLCTYYHIETAHHHRAVDDAACTAEIFVKFIQMFKDKDAFDLDQVNEMGKSNESAIRKMPTYHVIILAKNDIGRVNLYRLVSLSHLNHFARRPRIPKSELNQYREGLIVGSACEAGELYQAILRGAPDQEVARIVELSGDPASWK